MVLIARYTGMSMIFRFATDNMSIAKRELQLCLNKLQQWATDNGFRFFKTKNNMYAYLQKKWYPFGSTAFSGQKWNSGSRGDQISMGYI